ncbi:carbohydrate ABC transporter permease [Paenibacillus sp. MBLB4367]|uniref:carbohydrate ABC transporter permease n=1 Tax=Paenibacillus sp. MBLB4367 TaxID=3384767 RepID=UPI003908177C
MRTSADAGQSAKKRKSITTKDWFWGYVMIAPLMIGLLVFYIWPVVQTFFYTFTDWGAFGNYTWAGLDNYKKLGDDPSLLRAFRNTLIYIISMVPISIFLSILIATLLNQKIKGLTIYRTIYFLPVVTMPAAVAMVWKWLYNADYGLINYALSFIGIKGPKWLTDPNIALFSVVIVAVWSSIGHNMVIFLSGLQGISSSYYEAAEIDGAGPFTKFFQITLPLLSPTIFFVAVLGLINAFQVFDIIFLMVGNITIEATQSVVYLFFKYAFMLNQKGYAATVAVVLFAIIMIVTYVQMKLQKKWVHYE